MKTYWQYKDGVKMGSIQTNLKESDENHITKAFNLSAVDSKA